jgi:hypothetical protein
LRLLWYFDPLVFLCNVESKEQLTEPEWMLVQSYVWDAGDFISVDLGAMTSTSAFCRVKTYGVFD